MSMKKTEIVHVRQLNRVFLKMGALAWPNGYHWSPEALHADMRAAGALSPETVSA